MTGAPRPSADEVMAAAAAEFLSTARAAADGFDRIAAELATRPGADDLLTPFRRELHRLSGSAGTFGFARAGRMAGAMEAVVKRWIDDPLLDAPRRGEVAATFASGIRAQLEARVDSPRTPGRRLLIVGARDAIGVGLTAEAAARGFVVERVSLRDLDEALEDGAPYAMIAVSPAPVHDLLKATVTVELHADAAAAAAAPANPHVHGMAADAGAPAVLDALEVQATAGRAAVGTVLVLDDDPVMRTIVGVAALQVNLSTTAVADVSAFREALGAGGHSVVVVDVEIGAVSGLDLVREVRAIPAYASVPVLVLSGHRDDATRSAAAAAGAADYLVKPITMPLLAAKLAAWHAKGADPGA